jgi:mono/diheme cytochrome c family protein
MVAPPAASHPLVWDAMVKESKAKVGELTNTFTFSVTNTSKSDVYINALRPSCGCTVAKLPQEPWKLTPGTNGDIHISINLAGKHGLVTKTIAVETSHGQQTLMIKVDVPDAGGMTGTPMDRVHNQQLALADRQAVFRGDCATCHAAPAAGKLGEPLYVAVCGVCHEDAHRAAMVPNLKALPHGTDAEFWRKWITEGKPGTLMPAFASQHGGPLSTDQIESLVNYLAATIPSAPQIRPVSSATHSPRPVVPPPLPPTVQSASKP